MTMDIKDVQVIINGKPIDALTDKDIVDVMTDGFAEAHYKLSFYPSLITRALMVQYPNIYYPVISISFSNKVTFL